MLLVVIIYVTRKPKASIETPQAEIPKTSNVVEGELLERKTETSVKVSSLQEPLYDPSENRRNSHLERTPAIGSITQASSLCEPMKEASKEISHISAPQIELLGEMMVGEVSSSSLRSCVRKNSMLEAEGSNTNSPSYGSFTAEKKILKKKVCCKIKILSCIWIKVAILTILLVKTGGERWRRDQEGGVNNPS